MQLFHVLERVLRSLAGVGNKPRATSFILLYVSQRRRAVRDTRSLLTVRLRRLKPVIHRLGSAANASTRSFYALAIVSANFEYFMTVMGSKCSHGEEGKRFAGTLPIRESAGDSTVSLFITFYSLREDDICTVVKRRTSSQKRTGDSGNFDDPFINLPPRREVVRYCRFC